MSKMKTFLKRSALLALTALMVTSFVSGAWANPPKGKGKYGHEKNSAERVLKHGDSLHLTDEQKKDLHQMSFDHKKKTIQMKAEIDLAKLEVGRMFHEEPPAEEKILTQVDEIDKLKTNLKKSKIRLKFAVRKVLTKEQRDQLHEQRKKARKERMKRGMMGSEHRRGGSGRGGRGGH